jgi:hypothetical protein
VDAIADAELAGTGAQHGLDSLVIRPGDDQHRVGVMHVDSRKGLDEDVQSLLSREPTEREHDRAFVASEPRIAEDTWGRQLPKRLRVDSQRHDDARYRGRDVRH